MRASLAAALATLLVATRARAQSTDAATARELFHAAQVEMKSGEFAAACAKFAEAQRLDPNVGYLVNLARCDEKRDRLADARESWSKALDLAKTRNDPRLPDVQAGLEAIDRDVPRIVIRVAGGAQPDGLVIRRDDVTLTPASLGVPLPVNPGPHVVAASAPGREPWSKEISAQRGASPVTVEIPPLADAARSPVGIAIPAETAAASEQRRPGSTQRTLAVVAAGAGLVSLGFGTFFAFRAKGLNDDSSPFCDSANVCSDEGVALRDDALTAAGVSTVTVIAGGALVVTGIVLYLTAPSFAPRGVIRF